MKTNSKDTYHHLLQTLGSFDRDYQMTAIFTEVK